MSWFFLKDQNRRRYRKGIWLRVYRGDNPDVHKLIKESKLLRFGDCVDRMVIKVLLRDNRVLLEIWARNVKDIVRPKYRERFNVFYIDAKENPKWVCEGDIGRGLILKKRRAR
jgi:hypothetical protein